jgi:dTDP-4-dehydrorhamnose 3,5-epimerase
MKLYPTSIVGIDTVMYETHHDHRGMFSELFNTSHPIAYRLFPHGVKQVSVAESRQNVVRGLHLQYDPPMGKLIVVTSGMARIVNVDVRPNSPSYMKHVIMDVHADMGIGVYAPAWCARGYTALLPDTTILYLHDAVYTPGSAITINPFDGALGIDWETAGDAVVSEKDLTAKSIYYWEKHLFSSHPIFMYP